MRTGILLAVVLVLFSACRGPDGKPRQPFVARLVCQVERWLGQNDYRRREPGSQLCDADGVRIPEFTPPARDPESDAPPADDTS